MADPGSYGELEAPADDFAFRDALDPNSERRIYKIAPGEQAKYWDECRAGAFICVGWDEVGDLREFTAEDEEGFVEIFRERFPDLYTGSSGKLAVGTRKAWELWLLRDVQPGDIVIATRGASEVLALGEVVEPGYLFDGSREAYRHLVRVRWNESFRRDLAGLLDPGTKAKWMNNTIVPVERELYAAILAGKSTAAAAGGGRPPMSTASRRSRRSSRPSGSPACGSRSGRFGATTRP